MFKRLLCFIVCFGFVVSKLSLEASDKWQSRIQDLVTNHDFLFGVATSAYQVEGAWNQSGKGESIWDDYSHNYSENITDGSNGDVSCDSYNNLPRDIEMISHLNVDYYRFSISWSRILPSGFANKVNEEGIRYYHKLLDNLARKNIKSMVTIYHWDLPQSLQNLGGWTNPKIVDYFEDYAKVLFEHYGAKVAMWATINEPFHICHLGVGSTTYAPGQKSPGIGEYICMKNIHMAHARVYRLYDEKYREKFGGMVGFVGSTIYYVPYGNSTEDEDAAYRANELHIGWQFDPIYSKFGDYPEYMQQRIADVSKAQGFKQSRLPELSRSEVEYIRGTYDFIGINYYTVVAVKNDPDQLRHHSESPSLDNDRAVIQDYRPEWEKTGVWWQRSVPNGLRESLEHIKRRFDNPLIIISETGAGGWGEIDDQVVVDFYKEHLEIVHEAVFERGTNVRGWISWSLMDSYEWDMGYTAHFGLYKTNFSDPNRSTTIRSSGKFYRQINNLAKIARLKAGRSSPEPENYNDFFAQRSSAVKMTYCGVWWFLVLNILYLLL